MINLLITGANGYMARNLSKLFEENEKYKVFSYSKNELDLLDKNNIKSILDFVEPDIIIHAASKGGKRTHPDNESVFYENIKMYDNLMQLVPKDKKVFIFGSGAEFDRSKDINNVTEEEVFNRFPEDPYGASKREICEYALNDYHNTYILRLFGCFNYNEESFRFIKSCINNIKENNPIIIHQDRYMDFFYLDDIFTVIDNIIHHGGSKHLNLVYQEKFKLSEIANIIIKAFNKSSYKIIKEIDGYGNSYTGNGNKLHKKNYNLIGLEKGIKETINICIK